MTPGHLGDRAGDLLGVVVEPGRIGRRQLHLDRLAGRRAGFRHAHLDVDAGNAGHRDAQFVEDLVRRLALAPVDELVLDDADHVLGDVLLPPRVLPTLVRPT